MENIQNKILEKKQLVSEEKQPRASFLVINKKQILIRSTVLALILVVAMLAATFIAIANYKLTVFADSAGIEKKDIIQTLKTGWQQIPTETQNHKNLLILGLDSLETRGNSTPLTDSIMLVSINLKTGDVNTLPLPRDLWSEDYQAKINALYTYGIDKYPNNPEKFPEEVISDITSVPIHHTMVISMKKVSDLIDLVGGVEIKVEKGFVDEQFPRVDVDVTITTNPNELYETIEFKAGKQIMSGETALKYIRSRHGNNEQNTDNARSIRQQAVINALARSILSQKTMLNTRLLGKLYQYYLNNFASNLPPEEIISTGKKLLPIKKSLQLKNVYLDIYPDDPEGAIEHPPQYLYDGQWVYTIRNGQNFKKEIQQKLLDQKIK
ncbi:LCP family protein [Patescibacteria group bacterium]|nr:LCP family protein [Patescibacteria group bacterium]MBU1885230.1 LCP family protein [Patescibacteria group bacterium]